MSSVRLDKVLSDPVLSDVLYAVYANSNQHAPHCYEAFIPDIDIADHRECRSILAAWHDNDLRRRTSYLEGMHPR